MLVAAAAVTPGHDDPLQAVDITPLYAGDNRAYGDEVRHAVFERRALPGITSQDREEPHAIRPLDLLDRCRADTFRRFRRLGSRLKAGLAQRYEPRDERLRQRIEDTERSARDLGTTAMAELLDRWLTLRVDPPWQIDVATVREADWADLINDYNEFVEQLDALEAHLKSSPAPFANCHFRESGRIVGASRLSYKSSDGEYHD